MWLNNFNFFPLIQYLKKNDHELYKKLIKLNIKITSVDSYKYTNNNEINFLHQFTGKLNVPNQMSRNTFIFTFDTDLYGQPENNIFYYCIYLFMWVIAPSKIGNINNINTKYLFTSASRNFNNYRPGKIYNYIRLKEKTYYDQILISKFRLGSPFEMYHFNKFKDLDLFLDARQIKEEYDTWPLAEENSTNGLVQSVWTFDLPVYKDSLFHIVAENTVEEFFISEKTYKVFNAGQIPILCARKGAIQHLRDLGFDVFDDIINHNHYDQESDWKIRINRMHEILDHLATLDHEQIKFDTYQRRLYNQQRLVSVDLQKLVFDPIITQLKQHFRGE